MVTPMKAAVLRAGEMVVDEVPDPIPGPGQVLVRTLACGICGSDLHFRKHGDRMIEASRAGGMQMRADTSRDIVMGHEFCAEVVEAGPDTLAPAAGTPIVSVPAVIAGGDFPNLDIVPLGFDNELPGAYGELMVLSAMLLVPVPNGLDPKLAALTEPMAVGLHAVNKSGITAGDSALVLGCGPVGLSVIAALKARGTEVIVATDPSPARRAMASTMGATAVADPREATAIEAWREAGGTEPVVIYEAVGIPGMLATAMREAPRGTRITVVGVCMEPDAIEPIMGINKELSLQFVLAYDPFTEFAPTLTEIAEGRLDVSPMITGHVGLDGVAGAFDDLANPDAHCKIIVTP
jgi:threonine dehydrogenase-like Zn-dependent dehydrogenase